MEKSKSGVWGKMIWLIGFICLTYAMTKLEANIKDTVSKTYNTLPYIWFTVISMLVMGLYTGLLFVRSWKIRINQSLLSCVFLPCFVLAVIGLAVPLCSIYGIAHDFVNSGFMRFVYDLACSQAIVFVAGATLVMSLLDSYTTN